MGDLCAHVFGNFSKCHETWWWILLFAMSLQITPGFLFGELRTCKWYQYLQRPGGNFSLEIHTSSSQPHHMGLQVVPGSSLVLSMEGWSNMYTSGWGVKQAQM